MSFDVIELPPLAVILKLNVYILGIIVSKYTILHALKALGTIGHPY